MLGQEVEYEGKTYLVVRIIDKSITLYENDDGTCTKVEEAYAELRSQHGEVTFIPLFEYEEPFTNKKSIIKAVPLSPWRKK